ncbi:MAG: peptidylprolyl isomerase, partial [Ignavibacteriota bacterium]
RAKLEKILARLKAGEKFEDLASTFSDDPGSARNGGDLGWAKRGSFVAEFEAAAYTLEPGQYSDIIESDFGYHLIQLLEHRGNTIHKCKQKDSGNYHNRNGDLARYRARKFVFLLFHNNNKFLSREAYTIL